MITSRWRAAGLHLGISMLIAIAVSLFIVGVWYPGPLFESAGGRLLLALLVGVDVCLGPLATLVIFNPQKRRSLLLLDVSVIAVLQLLALSYGLYASFEGRPVYVAYGQGYFVAVSANQLDAGQLGAARQAEYKTLPLFGPHWVGTRAPVDAHEQSDLNFALGMTGMGIHYQPKYYAALSELGPEVAREAQPYSQLRARHPDAAAALDQALAKVGRAEADVRFVPLKTRLRMLSVLVDAHTGAVLDTLALAPS